MDKETLRMQMLAGVITESEYKAKLEEETEFKSELSGGNLMLNNASKQIYQYIKKNGFPVRLVTDKGQVIGDPNPNFIVSTKTDYLTKFDQKQGIDGLKSIVTKIGISGGGLYISGIGTNAPVVKDKLEGLQRDILSSFKFLEKAGEIQVGPTGGGFALRIKPDMLKKGQVTEALNEHMIGGIVGIGAINQTPSYAKTDYEMAFEHFLGERYELKPNRERDDIKDINEEEIEEAEGMSGKDFALQKIKPYLEKEGYKIGFFNDVSSIPISKMKDDPTLAALALDSREDVTIVIPNDDKGQKILFTSTSDGELIKDLDLKNHFNLNKRFYGDGLGLYLMKK
jgi:hypothetical protein